MMPSKKPCSSRLRRRSPSRISAGAGEGAGRGPVFVWPSGSSPRRCRRLRRAARRSESRRLAGRTARLVEAPGDDIQILARPRIGQLLPGEGLRDNRSRRVWPDPPEGRPSELRGCPPWPSPCPSGRRHPGSACRGPMLARMATTATSTNAEQHEPAAPAPGTPAAARVSRRGPRYRRPRRHGADA